MLHLELLFLAPLTERIRDDSRHIFYGSPRAKVTTVRDKGRQRYPHACTALQEERVREEGYLRESGVDAARLAAPDKDLIKKYPRIAARTGMPVRDLAEIECTHANESQILELDFRLRVPGFLSTAGKHLSGLRPSVCGKAPLFRRCAKNCSRLRRGSAAAPLIGGCVPAKQSCAAHRAA